MAMRCQEERAFPRISVVVPAYNVAPYITEAIDSLIKQTTPFFEIIVINDGSTDATADRLSAYQGHPLISVYHTGNQGLGPARNEGIKRAQGDYLYLFDSDDLLSLNFVESMSNALRARPDMELIFFSGEVFSDDNFEPLFYRQVDCDEFKRGLQRDFPAGLEAVDALRRTGRFTPSACLYLSRRALWNSGLTFKAIVHEDNELIIHLCSLARVTRVVDTVYFKRRLRNGSLMTSQLSRRNLDGYFQSFLSTWSVYEGLKIPAHRRVVRYQLHDLVCLYLHICHQAQLSPPYSELATFLIRGHFKVLFKSWSLFLPGRLRQFLRVLKKNTFSFPSLRKQPD